MKRLGEAGCIREGRDERDSVKIRGEGRRRSNESQGRKGILVTHSGDPQQRSIQGAEFMVMAGKVSRVTATGRHSYQDHSR